MKRAELGAGVARRLEGLSGRDRRAILVGLAILAPAIAWLGVVRPYRAVVLELREAVVVERELLARERALLREAPSLPDRIEAARLRLGRGEAGLVRSANLALAEAEVTGHLEGLARESRTLLLEARSVLPPPDSEPTPGLRPIRMELRGESDFEGVLEFVRRLEDDPLLLRMAALSLRPGGSARNGDPPRTGQRGQQASDEGPGGSGVIGFVVVIEAFAPEGVGDGPAGGEGGSR